MAKLDAVDSGAKLYPGADKGRFISLGDRGYVLKEQPLGRIRRFSGIWTETVGQALELLTTADPSNATTVEQIFSLLTDQSLAVLQVLIPDLDVEEALDEDRGATIPQLVEAFNVALDVNGLGVLRKAIPFLAPTFQELSRKRAAEAADQRVEAVQKRYEDLQKQIEAANADA